MKTSKSMRFLFLVVPMILILLGLLFQGSWLLSKSVINEAAAASGKGQEIQIQNRYPLVGENYESPFVAVGERLKPAVVFINVEKEQMVSSYPFIRELEPFRDFFNLPRQESEPRRRTYPASGTGLIIDKTGLVLTNNHMVEDATVVTVKLEDGSECTAKIVGTDPETDLALLDIDDVDEKHVAILGDSDEIKIGDWAIAMGNPLGLDWTLTVGVISAKGRSNLNIAGRGPAFQDFIQTDASINFGNSGGPLANIRGEVIGINTAINTSGQNIGFAIPINMAKEVVHQLREKGSVSRGYLGLLPSELTPTLKEALKLDDKQKGVFVETVEPKTPAEEGGLEPGDVIVEVDNEPVSDVTDFRFRVAKHAPGSELELTVLREYKEKKLIFTLADRLDYVAAANQQKSEDSTWMGLTVTSLQSPQARQMNLEVDEGVLVINVGKDSPAEGKISAGDVIVKIGSDKISSLSDWQKVTRDLKDYQKAVLVMFHPQGKEQSRFVALKE